MSNRKKPKIQRTTRLKDHKRAGKVLRPPMNTLPTTLVPWLRDSFPDTLWLCALIKQYGEKPGMLLATRVLDRIAEVLGYEAGHAAEAPYPGLLTGELTMFDLIPEDSRAEILTALKSDGLYEEAFPWVFVRALQKYEGVPGAWLLTGWAGAVPIIDADEPEQLLRDVVEAAAHGQSSTATKAKAIVLRGWLYGGKLSLPREMVEDIGPILERYPDRITEEERRRIEPTIRAMYMGMTSIPGDLGDERAPVTWAKGFWRQNWKLYGCQTDDPEPDAQDDSGEHVRAAHEAWRHEIEGLTERFLAASRTIDPDLYAPDRHEVLTGLVYRQLRAMAVMVGYPPLWTMEHGSSTIRGILEARIVVKWLLLKDDPDLYSRFKDYGRGRLKLLKLHLEEYRDTLDEVPDELDQQIDYMDALVNREIMEEFQDISIEGNFAGVDTRRMADQVGLITNYRLVFQPASANVHGEWAALDQYILTPCHNPLHRWHRIPNPDPMLRLGPSLVDIALGMLADLVADYEAGLGSQGSSWGN